MGMVNASKTIKATPCESCCGPRPDRLQFPGSLQQPPPHGRTVTVVLSEGARSRGRTQSTAHGREGGQARQGNRVVKCDGGDEVWRANGTGGWRGAYPGALVPC
jgi:hypothetical protein